MIKSVEFIISSPSVEKCPASKFPEYAFIGRSNVGKSSLINMLANRKGLAKTSTRPGKTQLINHFLINNGWYLVDLPGYGFAKAPKSEKDKWGGIISNYFLKRKSLVCICVLLDVNLPPQPIDLDFISWLGEKGFPFVLVFTKVDKQSKTKINLLIDNYQNELLKTWETLPPTFITSAKSKIGRDELLDFIEKTNKKVKISK